MDLQPHSFSFTINVGYKYKPVTKILSVHNVSVLVNYPFSFEYC